jgi:hypothetical protein
MLKMSVDCIFVAFDRGGRASVAGHNDFWQACFFPGFYVSPLSEFV